MGTAALCLEIFFCRILDVTCGTLRTVLTVKEKTPLAALLGFFEVFIWFLVVRQALNSSDNGFFIALSYAGGYACGTYVGGHIARRLIKSDLVVEVVTSRRDSALIHAIQDQGFAVTVVNVNPSEFGGEKYMLFSEILGKRMEEYKQLVHSFDPAAFIMIQETKHYFNGFIRKK